VVDCVAIVSGGFDSVTLLHHLVKAEKRKPAVMTFLYGQRHSKELAYAKIHAELLKCSQHRIVDLTSLKDLWTASSLIAADMPIPNADEVSGQVQPTTYVPNRNMIFLALAVAWAETLGVNEIFYGAQRHDIYGYWDTTSDFVNALNDLYALQPQSPVQIKAPFVEMSKADILRLGLKLGVDYALTWSCYVGEEAACGQCPTCVERLKAFAEVGTADPIAYTGA
jgi:7-cyano-7-deazaguanine synthase